MLMYKCKFYFRVLWRPPNVLLHWAQQVGLCEFQFLYESESIRMPQESEKTSSFHKKKSSLLISTTLCIINDASSKNK